MRICVSFLNWVSFGVAVILQSGCATVVNGTHDTINVVTEPSGAVVSTGVTSEETPCALRLSRSRDHKRRTIASTGIGNPRHASCLRTCRAGDSRTVKRDVRRQIQKDEAGIWL
jgi:hypothetical protein